LIAPCAEIAPVSMAGRATRQAEGDDTDLAAAVADDICQVIGENA